MRRSLSVAIGLVAACFGLPHDARPDLTAAASRKSAPDFRLSDAQGHAVRLSAYKGRVVLLDFWATWCEGCQTEIPWYVEFQKKYRKAGLSVIGVAMDEDGWQSVRPFLAEHHINYPVAVGDPRVAKAYEVNAMPVTLLIDRMGRIADLHAGVVDKDRFEKEIQALLGGGADGRAE
jgi:peroxiredoxin